MKSEKIRKIAARLNQERADKNIGFRMRGNRIVGFSPCQKSLIYLAALCVNGEARPPALEVMTHIDSKTPMMLLRNYAASEPCECHIGMTAKILEDYEFA